MVFNCPTHLSTVWVALWADLASVALFASSSSCFFFRAFFSLCFCRSFLNFWSCCFAFLAASSWVFAGIVGAEVWEASGALLTVPAPTLAGFFQNNAAKCPIFPQILHSFLPQHASVLCVVMWHLSHHLPPTSPTFFPWCLLPLAGLNQLDFVPQPDYVPLAVRVIQDVTGHFS